ncbi:MAG: hypothetical protein M0R22_11790 [Dehalococcoidia bacterium]|nr:hypothetical protein [Dehalococcoidia bacterium]
MYVATARLGIAGHAGIGHTHCPGGLIQDDTAGFAVAAAIIRDALEADTHVASLDVDPDRNTIRVTTVDGGTGQSSPRRGITPAEARMIHGVVGRDALLCQAVAIEALGRMYGQGVLETPVALAAALANSVIDTFRKKAPGRFHLTSESVATNSGLIGGMLVQLDGVDTSVMATVNASSGGIGPNEDLEGNVALGSKRVLMGKLGMLRCPTIVLEGKAYSPAFSDGLQRPTFLVRCQRDLDNIVVAEALRDSALELGYRVIFRDDAFPRTDGVLRRKTVDLADSIIRTAEDLKKAETGSDKVRVVAELARLVSQECGGVSFMTNDLHDAVRQVGLTQGTSAVLSMLVTKDYLAHCKIPVLEPEDVDMMKGIVHGAIGRIASRLDEANDVVDRLYEDMAPLESLLV